MFTILTDNIFKLWDYQAFRSPKAPSTYRMGWQLVLPLHDVYIFEGESTLLCSYVLLFWKWQSGPNMAYVFTRVVLML